MVLNSLAMYLKQIHYVYRTFLRVSPYMMKGTYCLQDNLRTVVRVSDKDKYLPYFRKEPKSKSVRCLIAVINAMNLFSNKTVRPEYMNSYAALYIANNNGKRREVKLLDVVNKKVKVFFVDSKAKADYQRLNDLLGDVYQMPKVYDNDPTEEDSLTVSLVTKKPNPSEAAVIEDICEAHGRLLQSIKRHPSVELSVVQLPRMNFQICDEAVMLIQTLESTLSDEWLWCDLPLCIQHGDLSADNIFYGEADDYQGYWWIDWEHIRERVFFYDVFFYILNTAVVDRNYVPTEEFLSGYYDEYLQKLFENAGMIYKGSERNCYFVLFAIEFVKERLWRDGIHAAIEKYQEYFNKYFMR